MDNKAIYQERLKRFKDALALKEPDRVPCAPFCNTYLVTNAGYTMADALYDTDKAVDAAIKYLKQYQPDLAPSLRYLHFGTGSLKEKLGVKWLQWAGQPGSIIDINSMQQYIEKPYMTEDDYPEFLGDITGWMLRRFLPQGYALMEPLKKLDFYKMRGMDISYQCVQFADPEVQRSLKTLFEIGEGVKEVLDKYAAFEQEAVKLGFPLQAQVTALAPFDQISDYMRSTLDLMTDMYTQPENVLAAVEKLLPRTVTDVTDVLKPSDDATNMIFMPLHKGMDGFMSDEHYRKFYWDTLLRAVNSFIEAGLTPWIYTEGRYDSRVECLMDVPKGKTLIHFEEADMARVKKLLGNVACISGGLSSYMLDSATKEQVVDKVKRIMDILAPGGGYIFDLGDGIEATAKPENVEALFETVKNYGKY